MKIFFFTSNNFLCQVLSANEKRLCTSLRLHPRLYISYKTCLLRFFFTPILALFQNWIKFPFLTPGITWARRRGRYRSQFTHQGWTSCTGVINTWLCKARIYPFLLLDNIVWHFIRKKSDQLRCGRKKIFNFLLHSGWISAYWPEHLL